MWPRPWNWPCRPRVATRPTSCIGEGHRQLARKPRLLSDNGSSYLSSDLADWLSDNGMSHVRGAPYHPQTQGKMRNAVFATHAVQYDAYQTLKNRILLENYFLPGDLEKIETVVEDLTDPQMQKFVDRMFASSSAAAEEMGTEPDLRRAQQMQLWAPPMAWATLPLMKPWWNSSVSDPIVETTDGSKAIL